MSVGKNGTNGSPSGRNTRRRLQTRVMPEILVSDHEAIKQLLRPHIGTFCEKLIADLKVGGRTGMNLFPRIMGAIGAEVEVNIELACTHAFGMTASEVRQLIEDRRRSSAVSVDQARADGVELLRWVFQQEPGVRGAVLEELGGMDAMALAEHAGPNGHA